jgi:hypothetical protein
MELIKALAFYNNVIDDTTRKLLLANVKVPGFANEPIMNTYFTNFTSQQSFDEMKYKKLINLI